jgi:hypothetical protein
MFHLVLDIDNTLLESVPEEYIPPRATPDKKLIIEDTCVAVWFRPYLRYFLECLRTSPDLVASVSFFSMGTKPYCEAIVNSLIPEARRTDRFPYRVFSREDADSVMSGGVEFKVKNLRRNLWLNNDIGATIKNTLIIDDNIYVHALHPHNVIRIKPFHTDFQKNKFTSDTFLKDIYDFLVGYQGLQVRFTIPPCKCHYTQIRGRDHLGPENVCFTCMTNHLVIRKKNREINYIYERVMKLHMRFRTKENGLSTISGKVGGGSEGQT